MGAMGTDDERTAGRVQSDRDPSDRGPSDRDPDEASAAARGTEHLQAAGRELIAAARAFLDVAEEAIEDSQVVDEAGAVFRDVMDRLGATARVDLREDGGRDDRSPSGDGSSSGGGPGSDRSDSAGAPGAARGSGSRVRRIDVE